jgi:hypothetical protein
MPYHIRPEDWIDNHQFAYDDDDDEEYEEYDPSEPDYEDDSWMRNFTPWPEWKHKVHEFLGSKPSEFVPWAGMLTGGATLGTGAGMTLGGPVGGVLGGLAGATGGYLLGRKLRKKLGTMLERPYRKRMAHKAIQQDREWFKKQGRQEEDWEPNYDPYDDDHEDDDDHNAADWWKQGGMPPTSFSEDDPNFAAYLAHLKQQFPGMYR